MRLLQLHEYLNLLDEGTVPQSITNDIAKTLLHHAQSIWPQLRIGAWADRERRIEYVAKCQKTGRLLVHVSANWENCFLIIVVPAPHTAVESYLLFDIGAEYSECIFTCPAFGVDQSADEEAIRTYLPKLLEANESPFAVLDKADGTFIQTYAEYGMYDVEHQLVSVGSHYCLDKRVDTDTAIKLFLSYAFGRKEWARDYAWEKMEL